MKTVVVILLIITLYSSAKADSLQTSYSGNAFRPNNGLYLGSYGGDIDVTFEYRRAVYDFATNVYKRLAIGSRGHFVFSPVSIWMSLAALAEGTDGIAREELFKLLNLPKDKCIRQQYYALSSRRDHAGNDAVFSRTRLFIFDENLVLNKNWEKFVCSQRLVGIIRGSLRRNPMNALQFMRNIFSAQIPYINLNGNLVIMDALDYEGLWTTAFQDAKLERVAFHNELGEKIGTVEMMRMKKRVKLAYLPDLKIKVLELPIGYNGRYRILFGLVTGNNSVAQTIKLIKDKVVFDAIQNLRTSRIPLDVAIPRCAVSFEFDVKSVLEELHVKNVWTDPRTTRNISDPAALPSGFVQRVTVALDRAGLNPYQQEISAPAANFDTGLNVEIGKDFIADRTFMFGAFDAETFTWLFTGMFSRPN